MINHIVKIYIIFIFLLVAASISYAEYKPFIDYMAIGVNTQDQIEIGLANGLTIPQARDLNDFRFYAKGKYLNTVIIKNKSSINASLDFIFPGVLIFGSCFTGHNVNDCYPVQYVVDIINGEIGYRLGYTSIAVVNEIHPFIYRGFMHVSGFKVSFGKRYQYGIIIYEQDWFKNEKPTFGVKTEFMRI